MNTAALTTRLQAAAKTFAPKLHEAQTWRNEALSLRILMVTFVVWSLAMIFNASLLTVGLSPDLIQFVRYGSYVALLVSEYAAGRITPVGVGAIGLACATFLVPGIPTYLVSYALPAAIVCAAFVGRRPERQDLLIIAAVLLMSLCCARAKTPAVLDSLVFCWAVRERDFSRFARLALITTALGVAVVVLLCSMGKVDNYLYVQGAEDTVDRIRWTLGFRYPLFPAKLVFLVTLLSCCLRADDIRIPELAGLAVLNVLCILLTDARLSCLCALAMIAGTCAVKFLRKRGYAFTRIMRLCVFSFLIAAVVSILLTLVYDPSYGFMKAIDSFLGGRLLIGKTSYAQFGPSIVGKSIEFYGNGLNLSGDTTTQTINYIDCLYLRLLVQHGIVGLTLFLGIMTRICQRVCASKNPYLMLALVFTALHCMVDDLSIYLYYNSLLLLIGAAMSTLPAPMKGDEQDAKAA